MNSSVPHMCCWSCTMLPMSSCIRALKLESCAGSRWSSTAPIGPECRVCTPRDPAERDAPRCPLALAVHPGWIRPKTKTRHASRLDTGHSTESSSSRQFCSGIAVLSRAETDNSKPFMQSELTKMTTPRLEALEPQTSWQMQHRPSSTSPG